MKQHNNEVIYAADAPLVTLDIRDIKMIREKASFNFRQKMRICTHKDVHESLHEMFIIHKKDTYVRPHRHNKIESFHIMEGLVDIILFDDNGNIINVIQMGDYISGRKFYYRISYPYFHTLLIRSEYLVFHEITNGPFNKSDIIFAHWSPEENDLESVEKFIQNLDQSVENFLNMNINIKCRLCDNVDLLQIMNFNHVPIADAFINSKKLDESQEIYALEIFLCRTCNHIQIVEDIYHKNNQIDSHYTTSSTSGLVDHTKMYAERIAEIVDISENTFIVNIGSNDGTLLKHFLKQSAKVLGIESEYSIAQLAEKEGVQTLPASFTNDLSKKIKSDFGPANIIILGSAHNLFANINDLANTIKGIRHLLAPDGILVFEVGYLVDIYQKCLFDSIYHEHLGYHSVQPLVNFFNRFEMRLFHVERVPIKGGCIRSFVQLSGGPHAMSSSVSKLISLESTLGVHVSKNYKSFMKKISDIKIPLLEYVMNLIRKNKKIIGYGASPTTTMLTYHFNLGDLLRFIVDDNPSIQGKFSPGYLIPILSPDAIYEEKPDYILILAWRYADTIIEKHQKFLKDGGHFIVPLPEMYII